MLKSDFLPRILDNKPSLGLFLYLFTNRGIIREEAHTVERFLPSETSFQPKLYAQPVRATHEPKQVPTDATEELEKETTVQPPVSDHPKCEDLVVAYGRWSLTRIEPQAGGFFWEENPTQFKEENLLHAISKLRYVQFYVVVVPTIRDQQTRQVKNSAKSLNRQPQLVVAVGYRRDPNCKT